MSPTSLSLHDSILWKYWKINCWWLIDWLVHLYPPITRKRRCAIFWTNPHPLRSWPFSKLSCWRFDFFPRKFAACSKPPSRDNYRKASYPRTQQREQGAGWTHDPAIRVVVKTTPIPIRPRCSTKHDNFRRTWTRNIQTLHISPLPQELPNWPPSICCPWVLLHWISGQSQVFFVSY